MTDDLLPLDEVAKSVFGMKPEAARRKAVLGQLSIPAFRLGNARKGPMYIRKSDLDKHMQERYEAAKRLTMKMTSVTPE